MHHQATVGLEFFLKKPKQLRVGISLMVINLCDDLIGHITQANRYELTNVGKVCLLHLEWSKGINSYNLTIPTV